MKAKFLLPVSLFALLSVTAAAGDYAYLRSFDTYPSPLPIAVDVSPTGPVCYYATFPSDGNCNVVMVPDFLASTGTTDQILIAGPITFVAFRGFQGIAADSTGKVYVSGDNGGGATSAIINKYIPNGSKTVWTPDAGFTPDLSARLSGLTLVNDSILAAGATITGFPRFLSATNGAALQELPKGATFQREATFNPDNNDLYIGHNDNGVSPPSLSIYKDGDPGNLAAYVLDVDTALEGATIGSTATQHNGYDRFNHQLLHVNMVPPKQLEIYKVSPGVRGAAAIQLPAVQNITDTTLGTPLDDVSDAAVCKLGGVSYLLITANNGSRIHVYVKQDDFEFVAGPKATTYDLGDGVTTAKVSNSDLLNGKVGTILSGGFHSATVGNESNLTNGVWDANGLTVIASDVDVLTNPQPSIVLEYTLSSATINKIAVFAGHDGDGSRAFVNCKVETDSGSGYTALGSNMVTGSFGAAKPNNSVVSDVVKYNPAGLATGVQKIKFSFYCVSHNSTGFFQDWNDNTTNPPSHYPNQGTVLKEIDVFGTTGPAEVNDWLLYN